MSFRRAHMLEWSRKRYSIEEWYGCRRKQPLTEKKATARAQSLNQKKTDSAFAFNAYKCDYCVNWHVGRYYKRSRKNKPLKQKEQ